MPKHLRAALRPPLRTDFLTTQRCLLPHKKPLSTSVTQLLTQLLSKLLTQVLGTQIQRANEIFINPQ